MKRVIGNIYKYTYITVRLKMLYKYYGQQIPDHIRGD